jgi:hypothetical protein
LRMLSLSVASCRNIAMRCNLLQDGVRLALTSLIPSHGQGCDQLAGITGHSLRSIP